MECHYFDDMYMQKLVTKCRCKTHTPCMPTILLLKCFHEEVNGGGGGGGCTYLLLCFISSRFICSVCVCFNFEEIILRKNNKMAVLPVLRLFKGDNKLQFHLLTASPLITV